MTKSALTFRPTPEHVQRLLGNHVILRCGDVHAAFAHLVPGSVAVEVGQAVRTGDPLGHVGHTGNSTAPHLHFHMMDSEDLNEARGIPCCFLEYEVYDDGAWRRVENGIPGRNDRIRRQ